MSSTDTPTTSATLPKTLCDVGAGASRYRAVLHEHEHVTFTIATGSTTVMLHLRLAELEHLADELQVACAYGRRLLAGSAEWANRPR